MEWWRLLLADGCPIDGHAEDMRDTCMGYAAVACTLSSTKEKKGELLRHGMMHDTMTQPDMEPTLPRRQSSTHAWHQACDSTSEWQGHEQG